LRKASERSGDKDSVNSDEQVKITFNLSECLDLLNGYTNLEIHVANKRKRNVKVYGLNRSIIAEFQKKSLLEFEVMAYTPYYRPIIKAIKILFKKPGITE